MIQLLGITDKHKLEPLCKASQDYYKIADFCDRNCLMECLLSDSADDAKRMYSQGLNEEEPDCSLSKNPDTLQDIEYTIENETIEDALPKVKQLFKEADVDGNGTISEDELKEIFSSLGEWSDEEFSLLFAEADRNGDGTLNYDEFLTLILGDQGEEGKAVQEGLKEAAGLLIDELYKLKDIKGGDLDFMESAMDAFSRGNNTASNVFYAMNCSETRNEHIEDIYLAHLMRYCGITEEEKDKAKPLCKAWRVFFELSEKNGGWLPWRTKLGKFLDSFYQTTFSGGTKEAAKEAFLEEAFGASAVAGA